MAATIWRATGSVLPSTSTRFTPVEASENPVLSLTVTPVSSVSVSVATSATADRIEFVAAITNVSSAMLPAGSLATMALLSLAGAIALPLPSSAQTLPLV